MRILHICMSQYTDGWSYQENLLAKYHAAAGHEVLMLTSMRCYREGKLTKDDRLHFTDVNGIPVTRLPQKRGMLSKKLPVYKGFRAALAASAPDLIFSHGCQYRNLRDVVRYVKKHGIRLIVDNHADFSNSARNLLSKKLLHGIIWRHYARMAVPFAEIFYGVLPARVSFLKAVYGVPAEKTALLLMGADDQRVAQVSTPTVRARLRAEMGLRQKDFVLVTGGKIDSAKQQILTLMEAVRALPLPEVKLVVFGSVEEGLQKKLKNLCDERVRYVGWLSPHDTYNCLAVADLAVFPGRHSVLWEQAAGMGIPLLVKRWQGTEHVDRGGNAVFIEDDSREEMLSAILSAKEKIQGMREVAMGDARNAFSYADIARRSLLQRREARGEREVL